MSGTRLRPQIAAASVLIIALATAACSEGTPEVTISSLPGKTLDVLQNETNQKTTTYVQDASPAVGEVPSYDASQWGSSQWEIVASCADHEKVEDADILEIAVIPVDRVNSDVKEQIMSGKFSDAVTCDNLEYKALE